MAVVTKEAYETCDTNTTITVLRISPANITLTTTGEHFFTSTFARHCDLGQKLAINVTASSMVNPPSTSTEPPSSGTSPVSEGPSGEPAPPSPVSSAPSDHRIGGFFITILSIVITFF